MAHEPARHEDERFLLRAFRSFAEAASSLESSYGHLRTEVEGLRAELEKSNEDLSRSLEENRRVRAHLDRILESLPCGVIVVSSEGRITRINTEAVRLMGLGSGPAPSSISLLPGPITKLLQLAGGAAGERELKVIHPGNVPCWLAASHAALCGAGDSVSVFILRDVTDRKRLEEEQEKFGRERALAEMSTLLAHEIRNPLGSLELFAGLLAESNLVSESRRWIEHIQAGLRTLAATVNNVLHFHSLPPPERAPVDLGRLLDWAYEFFTPLARQSEITLSRQNHLSGVLISADRHRLEQVLLNLVLNAVRATPAGGWIEIGGHKTPYEKEVHLRVTDTGEGIPPEAIDHIFEPGFSSKPGGAGLGLTVSRKIVEQHGGSISVKSRPSQGTTFTICLPLGQGVQA